MTPTGKIYLQNWIMNGGCTEKQRLSRRQLAIESLIKACKPLSLTFIGEVTEDEWLYQNY
jgi:hypothetical protein